MKVKNIVYFSPVVLLMGSLIGCNPKSKDNSDWITKENWYELTSNATKADIGKTAKVKVNGLDHLVRLIDIDHDIDSDGNKIHTTWEFANLISDKNGNSLSYLWSDNNNTNGSGTEYNIDYPNSTIRYALCGNGYDGGTEDSPRTIILAGVKGGTDWDNEYKDKTILSMLPDYFVNNLKTVRKTVGTTIDYIETPYEDKLFMPSAIELGYNDEYSDKGFGTTYTYYKKATKLIDVSRCKKQVNSKIINNTTSLITYKDDSGQLTHESITNCAGFNGLINGVVGGRYWLRSPFIPDSVSPIYSQVWYCDADGDLCSYYHTSFVRAFGIAPMFCI